MERLEPFSKIKPPTIERDNPWIGIYNDIKGLSYNVYMLSKNINKILWIYWFYIIEYTRKNCT